jgi:FkbM family methyltransferase
MRHIRVNLCGNVTVVPFALGDFTGAADLFLVSKCEDWCNSLRPPIVNHSTSKVCVEVKRADDVLESLGVASVDFIKLDIEGAELSFLKGAMRMLRESRPAILVEVQDCRTKAWGYAAQDILEFLERLNYRWFGVSEGGKLEAILTNGGRYDANLVALPRERVEEIAKFVAT